ncbi:hypothetical protein SDC9_97073 [bioreactor metagenome]|uniref:Uncharacterized protein n=1 Tax=bioreactor metagenome TaxID=1076179 RepID=A0A645AKY6_9ZZZZ
MEKNDKEAKNYTLTAAEIEKLLQENFGDKLQPVDSVKLAKQRQQQAKYRDRKK